MRLEIFDFRDRTYAVQRPDDAFLNDETDKIPHVGSFSSLYAFFFPAFVRPALMRWRRLPPLYSWKLRLLQEVQGLLRQ